VFILLFSAAYASSEATQEQDPVEALDYFHTFDIDGKYTFSTHISSLRINPPCVCLRDADSVADKLQAIFT
jgi:hypothetical protein